VVARVGSGGEVGGEEVREAVGAVFEVRIPLAE
jgi:hypothetical protein